MFSLVLSLLLSPMATPDTTASQPAEGATEAPAKEKLVCRYIKPPNSRLGKRECRTRKEWNDGSPSGSQMDMGRREQ